MLRVRFLLRCSWVSFLLTASTGDSNRTRIKVTEHTSKWTVLVHDQRYETIMDRIKIPEDTAKQENCDFAWNPPAVVLRGANPRIKTSHAKGCRQRTEITIKIAVPKRYVKINSKPKAIAAVLLFLPAPEFTIFCAKEWDRRLINWITLSTLFF